MCMVVSSRPMTTSPRLILCADFDNTITSHDTIHLLVERACRNSSHATQKQQQWEQFVDHYHQDVLDLNEKYRTYVPSSTANSLEPYLVELAAKDMESIQRVIQGRILQSIHMPGDCHDMIQKIKVRDGVWNVFQSVDSIHVISSNWSRVLIQQVLENLDMTKANQESQRDIQVHANALQVDLNSEDHTTTGDIQLDIQSPFDKRTRVQDIRRCEPAESLLLFIGDSINDVLALLEADVGFLIVRDEEKDIDPGFLVMLKKFGITCEPIQGRGLFELKRRATGRGRLPVLFTIKHWDMLFECLKKSADY